MTETEWDKTPIYQFYNQNGRWVNINSAIYTELDIKNLMRHINFPGIKEFKFVQLSWAKVMLTFEELLKMVNMAYFIEKCKVEIDNSQISGIEYL